MKYPISPPGYWRDRREWSTWLGRKGTVVGSTCIQVSSPELAYLTPYPYVLVDFGSERRAFMGTGHTSFLVGEIVECVWRRMGSVDAAGIIPYGIKVQRLASTDKRGIEIEGDDVSLVPENESEEDVTESENESNRRSTR